MDVASLWCYEWVDGIYHWVFNMCMHYTRLLALNADDFLVSEHSCEKITKTRRI